MTESIYFLSIKLYFSLLFFKKKRVFFSVFIMHPCFLISILINFKRYKNLFRSNFLDFIVSNVQRFIFPASPDGVNDCFRNVTAVKCRKRNFNFPFQPILFGNCNQIAITNKFHLGFFLLLLFWFYSTFSFFAIIVF